MKHKINALITSVTSTKADKKQNKWLSFGLKLVLTSLAIWVVLSNLDLDNLKVQFQKFPIWGILLTTLLHILSKVVSAERQLLFFKQVGAPLPKMLNQKWYFIAMFYSYLLPGGVSGDAYKVIKVIQRHPEVSKKSIAAAGLMDRVAGLSLLAIIATLFSAFALPFLPLWQNIIIGAIITGAILFGEHFLMKMIRKDFVKILPKVNLLSIGVQGFQLLEIILIFFLLGNAENWAAYATLFLVGSIASVLPITVGGLGIREMVFAFGAPLLGVEKEIAVAAASLFYISGVLSALPGMVFSWQKNA